MKKKLFLGLILTTQLFYAQEKSIILEKSQTVFIDYQDQLNIQVETEEQRLIKKSKNIEDYQFYISYNNFIDVSNIEGSTQNLKTGKKSKLNINQISNHDVVQENIFHSDLKYKHISMPVYEDSTSLSFSYIRKYKNPKFVSPFVFADHLEVKKSIFKIICDKSIEIGYKLFGLDQNKIKFTQTTENNNIIYTWESENIEPFKEEENMPNANYYIPHIIFYVKNYTQNNIKTKVLESPKDLYEWYDELIKQTNIKDQSALRQQVNILVKDLKTDEEKAKSVFYWVQKNLHYVAFEYGMGGFIPRDAVDVFEKKYGDCKDMANLITEMLKQAGLNASLTWIGTRQRPYLYNEVPTPQTDDHMIASVVINNKRIFLDATDKFCPFGFPSSMTQGKEALIGLKNKEFVIEKVPVVASDKNVKQIEINYKIKGNDIIGTAKIEFFGLNKSELSNYMAYNQTKEEEIWKSALNYTNEKINTTLIEKNTNEYSEKPAFAKYNIELENWIKNVSGKIILKPFLLFPFKTAIIETEDRKYGVERNFLTKYNINYNIELPENTQIETLPNATTFENNSGKLVVNYKPNGKKIDVLMTIETKQLITETTEFSYWNEFIKNLNKIYNQSIVLKNE